MKSDKLKLRREIVHICEGNLVEMSKMLLNADNVGNRRTTFEPFTWRNITE